MRIVLIVVFLFLFFLAPGAAAAVVPVQDESAAGEIIERYFSLPIPTEDPMGEARTARLEVLRELEAMPEEAALSIAAVLPTVIELTHKKELIEILGRIPSPASRDVLIPLLDDPDAKIRGETILGLRRLSSRIRRSGMVRVPVGPDFAPPVEGIVPYLICAAGDENHGNRNYALLALADTREPEAAAEIFEHLHDPHRGVRFTAACLLTEFGDDSGLPELREALRRLVDMKTEEKPLGFYHEAQQMLASFERITGESLGKIPGHPMIYSCIANGEQAKKDFVMLLGGWDKWWEERDKKAE